MRLLLFILFLVFIVACKKEPNTSKGSLHYPVPGPRVDNTREVFYQNNQVKAIYTQQNNYHPDGELDLIERIDSTFSGGIWLVQTYSITYTYNASKRLKNIFYSEGFGLNLQYNYVYDQKGKLLYSITQQYPHYPDTTFYFHLNNTHSYSTRKGSLLSTSYYSRNLDSVVNTNFDGGSTRLRIIYKRNHKTDLMCRYSNAYEPIISETNERVSLEMIDYLVPFTYLYTYERVYNENGYPVRLITYLDGKKRSEQFINYE